MLIQEKDIREIMMGEVKLVSTELMEYYSEIGLDDVERINIDSFKDNQFNIEFNFIKSNMEAITHSSLNEVYLNVE